MTVMPNSEIKFITLSTEKLLRIHTLDMSISKKNFTVETTYWGLQTSKALISITLESVLPLFTDSELDLKTMNPMDNNPLYMDKDVQATAVLFYVRSGVKYWMVGDSKGGISLHHFNGTFLKRGETGKAPITALDRFGQHVVFAGGNTIGTFQPSTMQLMQVCEEVGYRQHTAPVTDVLIDVSTSTSVVFATYANGDILAFETRHSVNNEYICKTISRLREKVGFPPLKLGGFKGGVAVWGSNSVLSFYNSAILTNEIGISPSYMTFEKGSESVFFKSMRMGTGGYLMVLAPSQNHIFIYESLVPFKTAATSSDFGNSRLLLCGVDRIGGAIAVTVGYQLCKRRDGGKGKNDPIRKRKKTWD